MDERMTAPEQEPKKPLNWKKELIEWLKAGVFALLFAAVLFGFVIFPVQIDGSSMNPTLYHSERVLLWKLWYTPDRGDIVVLSENNDLNERLVKRIIALEGDTVDIDEDGNVWVNGQQTAEPYILEPITDSRHGSWDYPITVPEGCIFVMGDNRNHSTDSRSSAVGMVPAGEVIGRVVVRLLPLNKFGLVH